MKKVISTMAASLMVMAVAAPAYAKMTKKEAKKACKAENVAKKDMKGCITDKMKAP